MWGKVGLCIFKDSPNTAQGFTTEFATTEYFDQVTS